MRASWLLALALTCCHGGFHRRGEWQVTGDASVGIPAGEFIFSSTGADAPEIAARLSGAAFLNDRTAMLVATSYRYYNLDVGSLDAFEFQVGPRYFPPIDFHVGKMPVAPFVDAYAGIFQSASAFPEGGTDTNVTGEFGGGLEVGLGKHLSVILGYRFRHLSNGGGNVPSNPGYNDNQFILGLGWRW